jgi:hypothetical protein
MFIFRRFQLIVVLTSKDEKKARKFHGRQLFFWGLAGSKRRAGENRHFRVISAKNGCFPGVQIGQVRPALMNRNLHRQQDVLLNKRGAPAQAAAKFRFQI